MPAADRREEPVGEVIEWRPGRSEALLWNVVGVVVSLVAIPLFALPVVLRSGATGLTLRVGPLDVLLLVVIMAALLVVHEAVHAAAMFGFGARPAFGATLVGGVLPAFYTTAPGRLFSRRQYLTVAGAPAMVISGLGFVACFGPWAGYIILPLALHLGGCVGDGFAAARILREPHGTECEDLRDGLRFHRSPAAGIRT